MAKLERALTGDFDPVLSRFTLGPGPSMSASYEDGSDTATRRPLRVRVYERTVAGGNRSA
jgi:hypothetical protein